MEIMEKTIYNLKIANLRWKIVLLCVLCFSLPASLKILGYEGDLPAESFLTMHINIEFFCVFVALCIFTVTWYSHLKKRNYFSYFIGLGLLAVGFIDLFHLYAYEGMPVIFSSPCPNRATLFHIIGRIIMSCTFLLGLLLYNREMRIGGRLRLLFLAATLGLVGVILGTVSLNSQLYPVMFIKGQGLTEIKMYCEYIIIIVFSLATAGYIYLYKKNTEPFLELIVLTMVLSIFSEMCFASYKNVYAATNFLGHVFRFTSYILIYVAFFLNNVKKPYLELCSARVKLHSANQALEERVKERTHELEQAMEKLARAAFFDALTGAANRQEFSRRFRELIENSRKRDVHSIMAIDFDSFKNINDTYGHAVGDECLKTFVLAALEVVRPTDTVARFGGDEFMLILPHTPLEGAVVVAGKIRNRLAEVADPSFTVSVGVAQWPEDGKKEKELLARADQSLYLAKEMGKNRVVISKASCTTENENSGPGTV